MDNQGKISEGGAVVKELRADSNLKGGAKEADEDRYVNENSGCESAPSETIPFQIAPQLALPDCHHRSLRKGLLRAFQGDDGSIEKRLAVSLIFLEGVACRYRTEAGDVQALWPTDLSIEAGEWIVVLGSSGSGKTTLINLLSGMEAVSEGRLVVDGEVVS